MKKLLHLHLSVIIFLLIACVQANAQVTTATISGIVKDPQGKPLSGATVLIEFPDAGIRQSLVTKDDGRFTVPNLRVGGPYKVTIKHVSYSEKGSSDIFLDC